MTPTWKYCLVYRKCLKWGRGLLSQLQFLDDDDDGGGQTQDLSWHHTFNIPPLGPCHTVHFAPQLLGC